jgi:hypothetical protein
MDVLYLGKTGTIKLNQLAVTDVIADRAFSTDADVLMAGAVASQEVNQDSNDLRSWPRPLSRGSCAPFDANNRRTDAVVVEDGHQLRVIKFLKHFGHWHFAYSAVEAPAECYAAWGPHLNLCWRRHEANVTRHREHNELTVAGH